MSVRKASLVLPAVLWVLLTAAAPSRLPPAGYDPSRDPAADLKAAIPQAQKEHKRILLEVGGEWCVYCRLLNKTIHENQQLLSRLESNFIVLKVNFSDEVKNEAFLSRYPKIPSYPHLFVLDADGKLLLSQTPDDFLKNDKYVADLVLAFVEKWGPKAG
jgi:thioredoxin-related protein